MIQTAQMTDLPLCKYAQKMQRYCPFENYKKLQENNASCSQVFP